MNPLITILALAVGQIVTSTDEARRLPPPRAPDDVSDLPVVEVPAVPPGPGDQEGGRLAILITGDGGWVGLDRKVAVALSEHGVAVAGLDSLRYFWRKRSEAETTEDVARIARHYLAAWNLRSLLLVGYSRGADIVPFVAGQLAPDVRERLKLVAMLAPGTYAEFEVHAMDLLVSIRRRGAPSTERAVRATQGAVSFLCVQGAAEDDSLCPHLGDLSWVKTVVLPGNHHFDRDYPKLAGLILDAYP